MLFFALLINTSLHAKLIEPIATNHVIEKNKISLAAGGKSLIYYLPLTLADRLGYFKEEGLQVEISDFAGGSKALQAVVGGSSDIAAGAYEHTIKMQEKNQPLTAFVLYSSAPQIVMAVSRKTLPQCQEASCLRGKKIGISAPGSSTHMFANLVLAKAGLTAKDVSFIGVGTSAGAVAAMRAGKIDAIVNTDPVISMLEQHHDINIIADSRSQAATQDLFGGAVPSGVLYAKTAFIAANPNTIQALANAQVRALRWFKTATPAEISKVVPESYLLGDPALYQMALVKNSQAFTADGYFPSQGPETLLRAMKNFDASLNSEKIDLAKTWTNKFSEIANEKYK